MLDLTPQQCLEIAWLGQLSDGEVRSDLVRGYLSGEDDYTSNFTSAFRRNVNTYARSGLEATSLVLNQGVERITGCDAAIIICGIRSSKIILFEAKWPRITESNYKWDSDQTSTGLSHFTDQLHRQKKIKEFIAVFEMFYCECPASDTPSFMLDFGSTCIWHDEACKYLSSRPNPNKKWNNGDLESMLSRSAVGIHQVLTEVCACRRGKPVGMNDADVIAIEFRLPPNTLVIRAVGS